MADKQVDARGLSCPEPVLLAKEAIDSLAAGLVEVLVDTAAARDNVSRIAVKLGCDVEVEPQGEDFKVVIRKG